MGKIHMEPPQVRDLARRLEHTAGDLYSQSRTLQRAASRLPNIWEGGHSASHQRDFQRYLRALDRAVDDLQELALRVGREADQWEAADGDGKFTMTFSGLPGILPGAGFSFFPGGGARRSDEILLPWTGRGGLPPFDWFEWGKDEFKDITKHIWDVSQDLRYSDYRAIGRYFNQFVGNQKAGWVGKWDDFGHFLRNPAISKIMPVGINAVFGLMDGENLPQAVVSGALEAGAKWGIRLIPIVGTVMLVSDAIQVVGTVAGAGLELVGAHGAASFVQNGLDVIDLGGYVEDITDGVADLILPPYNEPPDFSELNERLEITNQVAHQLM